MIVLILILINIVSILYICLKYYRPKQYTTEDLKDKDSIILGYINDKGFNNNFDLILAEIIELNIKGYITIEYSKDNFNKYNYSLKQEIPVGSNNLKGYEMLIMNFLFSDKVEITKMELEEKLKNTFGSYNVQFNDVDKLLIKQLKREEIIDETKQNEFNKRSKRNAIVSILLVILVSILGVSKIMDIPLIYICIYALEKVVEGLLLLKVDLYTDNGKNIELNIDIYKKELQGKEFLTDKTTMKDIVLNKEFADSIALHINTFAKKAFINDKLTQEANKMTRRHWTVGIIIFAAIIISGFILSKVANIFPKELIFWFYLIFIIIIACVADIAYMITGKKK